MSRAPLAPQIEFAKKHITTDTSTFDARSAIIRLENLLDDVDQVQMVLEPILEERMKPAFFEFVSYYKVGFVTCLEWHAKSRLFDLFNFDPSVITNNDVKQGLSNSNITQMVSEKLSIPHLLVGSFNITSLEKYVNVIERVFSALNSKKVYQIFLITAQVEMKILVIY